MTPKEVLEFAKENEAKVVDLRFMDFPGVWQHFTVPLSELEESSFEDGFGFDGSSIRGWQPIHASDMLVVPDAATIIHQRPSQYCKKGGNLPQKQRNWRYRLLRA